MGSEKTRVIETLFFNHWDEKKGSLSKSIMTLEDVSQAIRDCQKQYEIKLSDRNPANFMKDFMRGNNASKNWPQSVAERRFTAVQRTGTGDAFEFIPYEIGQSEPFIDAFKVRADAPRYPVQSISLPLITKTLGRKDESWLIQTAINLRIVETHFAVGSKIPILEISPLQMSIKLRQTEIDALFLGLMDTVDGHQQVIITCEAKHYKDPFIPQQLISQVQAALQATSIPMVVPIGLKAIQNVGFYLVEFQLVKRQEASNLTSLKRTSDAVYELKPPVKGI